MTNYSFNWKTNQFEWSFNGEKLIKLRVMNISEYEEGVLIKKTRVRRPYVYDERNLDELSKETDRTDITLIKPVFDMVNLPLVGGDQWMLVPNKVYRFHLDRGIVLPYQREVPSLMYPTANFSNYGAVFSVNTLSSAFNSVIEIEDDQRLSIYTANVYLPVSMMIKRGSHVAWM